MPLPRAWLAVAGIYGSVAGIALAFAGGFARAGWFFCFLLLALLDLFALAKAMRAIMRIMTCDDSATRRGAIVEAGGWGLAKLGCLGVIAAVLFVGDGIPAEAAILGVSALVVVPLGGGIIDAR